MNYILLINDKRINEIELTQKCKLKYENLQVVTCSDMESVLEQGLLHSLEKEQNLKKMFDLIGSIKKANDISTNGTIGVVMDETYNTIDKVFHVNCNCNQKEMKSCLNFKYCM